MVSGGEALSFSGFGSYGLDAGGSWTLSGTNTLAAGQTLSDLGTLTLQGSLANAGTIAGGRGGIGVIVAAGGALANATGARVSGYFDGVWAQGALAGALTNLGTIQGAYLDGVALAAGGAVVNGGVGSPAAVISGAYAGVYSLAGTASVTNFGVIRGTSGEGVQLLGSGAVYNGSTSITGALIQGSSDGVYIGASTGRVTNFGTIAGGQLAGVLLATGGTVVNGSAADTSALITGGIDGLYAGIRTATLANFGTLIGAGGAGVYVQSTIALTNGSISSSKALISGYIGIYAAAAAVATVTNFGTIQGTGGVSVSFHSSKDRLIDEGGSTLIGVAKGGGGVLELAAGGGKLTGLGSAFTGFGAYVVDAGKSWTLSGTNSLAAARTLTNQGSLSVAGTMINAGVVTGGSGLSMGKASVLINGAKTSPNARISGSTGVYAGVGGAATVTNFATIQGTGGTSVVFKSAKDRLIVESGSIFLGAVQGGGGALELAGVGGTVTGLGGSATLAGAGSMTFSNFGALQVDAGASLSLTGANTLASASVLSVFGGLTLSGVVSNGGTINGLAGSALGLFNGDIIGGHLQAATIVGVSGASNILDGTTGALVNSATLEIGNTAALAVSGSITNSGAIDLAASTGTTSLVISAAGATLNGRGSVVLGPSAYNTITGATPTATLTNFDNTISGSGAFGAGKLQLVNQAAGVIDQTGAVSMTIDVGAATISNAGTIESTGAGGAVVASAVNNTGLLEAVGGSLTLNGAVTGAGSAVISGGTLSFGAAFTENVKFAGTTGTLVLAQSRTYTGTISGFSLTGGTALDLRDISFVSSKEATFKSGVLTVTDGSHTAKIKLAGNFIGSTWVASGDGHGGVIVIDPHAPVATAAASSASPQALVAAMAAMSSDPVTGSPLESRVAPSNPQPLVAPPG